MKHKGTLLVLLFIGIAMAGFYGCGGGGGGNDVTIAPAATGLNAASAVCAQCHGGEAGQYAHSLHNTENAATCAQCHSPAPGHPNPTTAVSDPDAVGVCGNCHVGQALTASGRLPHVNTVMLTAPVPVPWVADRDGEGQPAQYVDRALTASDKGGCKSCHNPHDTTTRLQPIFRVYAQSAHGDINGPGWTHYRWKGTDRAACQKCHTTSGLIARIEGDPTTQKFNDQLGVVNFSATDMTKQTLYCNGCHTDYNYDVRSVGAVTNKFTNGDIVAPETSRLHSITFPDVGKSNLCLMCHTGREDGQTIKLANAIVGAPAVNFTNRSFYNSHYLTAGTSVFGPRLTTTTTAGANQLAGGYTYPGRDYANRSSFAHDKIGTPAEPGTGNGGPCVGCHMTPANHKFVGWTKDAAGKFTAITSTVCAQCHAEPHALTVDDMNTEKEHFKETLEVFAAQLAAKGFHFFPSHPYFFNAPGGQGGSKVNWLSTGDVDTTGNTTGKHNMGAAFNFNFLEHDPGAYAHNRYYTKRLIWDSIDWLDNNVLDNSTLAAIDALAVAGRITATQQAAAKGYLPRNGARP